MVSRIPTIGEIVTTFDPIRIYRVTLVDTHCDRVVMDYLGPGKPFKGAEGTVKGFYTFTRATTKAELLLYTKESIESNS